MLTLFKKKPRPPSPVRRPLVDRPVKERYVSTIVVAPSTALTEHHLAKREMSLTTKDLFMSKLASEELEQETRLRQEIIAARHRVVADAEARGVEPPPPLVLPPPVSKQGSLDIRHASPRDRRGSAVAKRRYLERKTGLDDDGWRPPAHNAAAAMGTQNPRRMNARQRELLVAGRGDDDGGGGMDAVSLTKRNKKYIPTDIALMAAGCVAAAGDYGQAATLFRSVKKKMEKHPKRGGLGWGAEYVEQQASYCERLALMHPRKIPQDLRDQKAGDKRANPKFAGYDRYSDATWDRYLEAKQWANKAREPERRAERRERRERRKASQADGTADLFAQSGLAPKKKKPPTKEELLAKKKGDKAKKEAAKKAAAKKKRAQGGR